MLELSYKVKEYKEKVPNAETGEDLPKVQEFRDLIKLDEPNKGRVFMQFKAFDLDGVALYAFSNPKDLPANRYVSVSAFITLAQAEPTTDDLKQAFAEIHQLYLDGDYESAAAMSQKCMQLVNLTDNVTRWVNLSTTFLMFGDENPLYFDTRTNSQKMRLFESQTKEIKKKIAEWTRDHFDRLIQALMKDSPECFIEDEEEAEKGGFFNLMQAQINKEKQMSIFINTIGGKSPSDRDRLLNYTVSQLYADMRTFIIQGEQLNEELQKRYGGQNPVTEEI